MASLKQDAGDLAQQRIQRKSLRVGEYEKSDTHTKDEYVPLIIYEFQFDPKVESKVLADNDGESQLGSNYDW
jgi:hypothetical protein